MDYTVRIKYNVLRVSVNTILVERKMEDKYVYINYYIYLYTLQANSFIVGLTIFKVKRYLVFQASYISKSSEERWLLAPRATR